MMLKDFIKDNINNIRKEEKNNNKKSGERAPFSYSNKLEISVYKNDKLVETYTHNK